MASVTNGRLLFNSIPTGMFTNGIHASAFTGIMISVSLMMRFFHQFRLSGARQNDCIWCDRDDWFEECQIEWRNFDQNTRAFHWSLYERANAGSGSRVLLCELWVIAFTPLTIISTNTYRLHSRLASRKYLKLVMFNLNSQNWQFIFIFIVLTCSIYNFGVGVVVRSEFSGVQPGDHVYGILREFLNYYLLLQNSIFRYWCTHGSVPALLHQAKFGPS